ncbi:MAG: GNAT family N-acetyltransferase [Ilumatobacteraceae bacterium]
MAGPEIPEFLVASRDGYIADRVASGDDLVVAGRGADQTIAAMFPDGEPGPDQLLYRVEEDGRSVGSLWISPVSADRPEAWWVWDITIYEGHRGRGIGKSAMFLAEREARSHGATELGLNVFGSNTVARHLYEQLGYGTVAVRMSKRL